MEVGSTLVIDTVWSTVLIATTGAGRVALDDDDNAPIDPGVGVGTTMALGPPVGFGVTLGDADGDADGEEVEAGVGVGVGVAGSTAPGGVAIGVCVGDGFLTPSEVHSR